MNIPQEYIMAFLGLLGVLIGIIYKIQTDRISELKTKFEKMQEGNIAKHENLANNNLLMGNNISHIQTDVSNINKELAERQRESARMERDMHTLERDITGRIHEIELTVAELGGVYATKAELNTKNEKR